MNEPIKMWYAHTTEHYSPLERKEILTHATTWVNSEDVMLREIAGHQKANTVWFHVYEVHTGVRFIEKVNSGCQGVRGGRTGS